MEKNHRKTSRSADRRDRPSFLDPDYIDDYLVGIVKSHITNELYTQTDLIGDYAYTRVQYYLCTRDNVPEAFWDQSLESVLRRSTSGVSRALAEAVSDACEAVREACIQKILKPDQRAVCRKQIQGRMKKTVDSIKLIVRENIMAAHGIFSLAGCESQASDAVRTAAQKGTSVEFSCEIHLKAGERKSVQKWYSDLRNRRKEYEKGLLQAKLEKKKKMERELALQEKVLTAIPDRYRDLYPRARAMRRRFILHVGPTNSGKTYIKPHENFPQVVSCIPVVGE